jgi:hypothetical protein
MATNPNYEGLLAINNTWAGTILFKHVTISFMILLAAYQSSILYPKLTRRLLLSIIILLLTAIARTG